MACYNLGYDVPYKVWKDVTGKYSNWPVISEKGRSVIRPIFEALFNHFVHRCGLDMPYTEDLLEKFRPEGFNPEGDCSIRPLRCLLPKVWNIWMKTLAVRMRRWPDGRL